MSRREEGGHTVVELMVVVALVSVLLAAFGSAVRLMTSVTHRLGSSAGAVTQARAASDALSRSMPFASAANTPTRLGNVWYIETLTTAGPAGTAPRCTQWQLDLATRLLRVRSWPQGTTSVTAWTTAARGAGADPAGRPPFSLLAVDDTFTLPRVGVALAVVDPRGGASPVTGLYTLRNAGSGLSGGLSAAAGTDVVCTEVARS